jgi:adenylate cyclase class 2
MTETEVKYRLAGPEEHDRLRSRLTELGARGEPMRRETNLRFDTRKGKLKRRGRALRLRAVDHAIEARLTLKGRAARNEGLKSRHEIEVDVSDIRQMLALLGGLGYQVVATYTKLREPWYLDGVEITLDTLEFGWFCELEGSFAAIARVSEQLGLAERRPEQRSYPELARMG